MSKWGAHISLGKRDGFGAALAQCHAAGSPVSVLFALDQNVMDDVVRYSPSTMLIFRTQIGGYPNPPGLWNDDPVGLAEAWYQYRRPIWRQNPAHYYAPGNEYDPQTLEQFDWLDRYELRLMQLADQDGLKLAIGAPSGGPARPNARPMNSAPMSSNWARNWRWNGNQISPGSNR